MKLGQEVNLYFPLDGSRVHATVTEIKGAGPSRAKKLNLQYKEGEELVELEDVPHHGDAVAGETFWMVKGLEKAPKGWDEQEPTEPLVEVEPTPVAKKSGRKK